MYGKRKGQIKIFLKKVAARSDSQPTRRECTTAGFRPSRAPPSRSLTHDSFYYFASYSAHARVTFVGYAVSKRRPDSPIGYCFSGNGLHASPSAGLLSVNVVPSYFRVSLI